MDREIVDMIKMWMTRELNVITDGIESIMRTHKGWKEAHTSGYADEAVRMQIFGECVPAGVVVEMNYSDILNDGENPWFRFYIDLNGEPFGRKRFETEFERNTLMDEDRIREQIHMASIRLLGYAENLLSR